MERKAWGQRCTAQAGEAQQPWLWLSVMRSCLAAAMTAQVTKGSACGLRKQGISGGGGGGGLRESGGGRHLPALVQHSAGQ